MKITPTVGRVILARMVGLNSAADQQPYPALISRVNEDGTINIGGFNDTGAPFGACNVPIIEEDTSTEGLGWYAMWMPYQKEQAAKTAAIESGPQA